MTFVHGAFSAALLIVDRRRRVVGGNAAGLRALTSPNCLWIAGGRILGFGGPGSTAFLDALEAGFGGSAVNASVAIRDGVARGTWIVRVRRPTRYEFRGDLRVAVALELEPPPAAHRAALFTADLFGLTPAEVEVLEELLGGMDLEAIASRLSTTTAMIEVRQAELIRKTVSRDRADLLALTLCAANLAGKEWEDRSAVDMSRRDRLAPV